ncbi:MAG: hypothetical protein KJ061_02905 [Vicinamibacteraceae bacterium]|nr:hypothetical protein [Vicinamibacteraceae bacterium]
MRNRRSPRRELVDGVPGILPRTGGSSNLSGTEADPLPLRIAHRHGDAGEHVRRQWPERPERSHRVEAQRVDRNDEIGVAVRAQRAKDVDNRVGRTHVERDSEAGGLGEPREQRRE